MRFAVRLTLMLAVLVLALSCASDEGIRFRLDRGTTLEEEEIVLGEMAKCNAMSGLPSSNMSLADDGEQLISFVESIPTVDGEMDGRECTSEGQDCVRGGWVRVRRGLPLERKRRVTRHELAHTLDMHHVKDPSATMFGGFITADDFNESDFEEARRAGARGQISIRSSIP